MQNAGDEYACLWMGFAHVFCVCLFVYMYGLCACILHIWKCVRSSVWVHMYMCVQIFRRRDRGVCKGVSVYDDGKAELLSFNTVLVGHWAICKCTELTAEAQSSLVHPPTSSTTDPPPSIPPTVCLSCLTEGCCCPMKQRRKLLGAMSSSQPLCRWSEQDRVEVANRDWYFCNTWTTVL